MTDVVIRAEGLGKRYVIGHQSQRESYTALRDVVARGTQSFLRKSRDLLHGRPVIEGDQLEELWALRDVTFEVGRGEVVGIIGRNGAGKSTLLKVLSRITEPTKGRVEIRGRIASLLEVGTGFHPELTGRENIYLNGAILGMAREEIKRKFDEIAAFAEVERFLDTPVKRYSSGMYVRLAFAVAAHLEPEILIVDEVLAVGDATFQKKCLGKLKDVSGQGGRTVLFVSHNMGAVTTLCGRGLWLDNGSIQKTGPPREVVTEYLSQKRACCEQQILNLSTIARQHASDNRLRLEALEWLCDLPLRHGESVRARIEFRTTSPIEEVSIGIGFSSIEGTRMLTYETDFSDGYRPSLANANTYSAELEIDSLPLAPGVYSLDIGCRSGDSHGLDYLPAATQAEVIAGSKTPGYIVRQDAGVRLPGRWSWNR